MLTIMDPAVVTLTRQTQRHKTHDLSTALPVQTDPGELASLASGVVLETAYQF